MRNELHMPSFWEWSGLFSDKLFVMTQMLESFSDESSTHDLTGQRPGAASPTMAGLIADRSYWSVFRKKWERILNKYGVDNFHFVDWVQHKKPYDQWNNVTHYAFACELASLIGEVALPAGGSSNAKRCSELLPEDNPWEKSVEGFYHNVISQLNKHWAHFKGRVMFIHEECGDKTIRHTIDEVHSKQTDPRIGQLIFAKKIHNQDGTKSDDPVLAFQLQAADLFAGLMKQQTERVWESKDFTKPKPRTLDFLISGKSEYCEGIGLLRWRFFTKSLIKDEKIKKSMWEKAGIKQKYYPLDHFDFDKYGFKFTRENAV